MDRVDGLPSRRQYICIKMNSPEERNSKYSCVVVPENSRRYSSPPSTWGGGLSSWKCNSRRKVPRIDFPRSKD